MYMAWYNFFRKSEVEQVEINQDEPFVGPTVVWIHGAGQSSLSFKYLRTQLPNWPGVLIDYSSSIGFADNLEEMVKDLGDQPLFIIGHSLGGIYGVHLLERCNVMGAVSISTPYRGSSAADWAKYIVPNYPLFKDVGRRSLPILKAQTIPINVPWTQMVSTGGAVPYLRGPNDGVCTVESMEYRKADMECIHVDNTHYEIMCSDEVVKIIHDRYNAVQATYAQLVA
jgi:pimeloyl-ACP methyl ester carboxylesterase